MIEKMKEYYESEFKGLECALNKHYTWTTPKEMKNNALQRMLGVAFFAGWFDIDSRDIEKIYNEYEEKVEAL